MAQKQIILLRSGSKDAKPNGGGFVSGELAVNYSAGSEKLYIKNSSGNVVSFSTDEQIIKNIKQNVFITDLKLPTGGNDGMVLKKNGSSLIWGEDNTSSGGGNNSGSVVIEQKVKNGTEIAVIKVDGKPTKLFAPQAATLEELDKSGYLKMPTGGTDGQVLKKSGNNVVWGNDDTSSGGGGGSNNSVLTTVINGGGINVEKASETTTSLTYSLSVDMNYINRNVSVKSDESITIQNGTGINVNETANGSNSKQYTISANINEIIPNDGDAGDVLTKTTNGFAWRKGSGELPTEGRDYGKVLKVGTGGVLEWADDAVGGNSDDNTDEQEYVKKSGDEMSGTLNITDGRRFITLGENGILKVNPESATFDVNDDNIKMTIDGGTSFYIDANGILCTKTRITAQEFYEESDINLKENISNIADIEKISDVSFKQFNYKTATPKDRKYGVIAQDVEKAGLDNLVTTNDNGFKSVDYISLLCLKIAQLEERIKELEENNK